MNNILNAMSVISTFAIAQILVYLFFNILFFKISGLNRVILFNIQIKHILYFSITTYLLWNYTVFYLPYGK